MYIFDPNLSILNIWKHQKIKNESWNSIFQWLDYIFIIKWQRKTKLKDAD